MRRHLDGRRSDLTSSIRAHRPICSALIPRMSEIRLLVQPGILTPILLGACARASPHHHLGHVLPKLSYHRPYGPLPAGTIIGQAFHALLFKRPEDAQPARNRLASAALEFWQCDKRGADGNGEAHHNYARSNQADLKLAAISKHGNTLPQPAFIEQNADDSSRGTYG